MSLHCTVMWSLETLGKIMPRLPSVGSCGCASCCGFGWLPVSGVLVGVGVGVLVGVAVAVAVGVAVGVLVGVFVAVGVEVAVGVLVGVLVAVGVDVAVGVGVSVGSTSWSCCPCCATGVSVGGAFGSGLVRKVAVSERA